MQLAVNWVDSTYRQAARDCFVRSRTVAVGYVTYVSVLIQDSYIIHTTTSTCLTALTVCRTWYVLVVIPTVNGICVCA